MATLAETKAEMNLTETKLFEPKLEKELETELETKFETKFIEAKVEYVLK